MWKSIRSIFRFEGFWPQRLLLSQDVATVSCNKVTKKRKEHTMREFWKLNMAHFNIGFWIYQSMVKEYHTFYSQLLNLLNLGVIYLFLNLFLELKDMSNIFWINSINCWLQQLNLQRISSMLNINVNELLNKLFVCFTYSGSVI